MTPPPTSAKIIALRIITTCTLAVLLTTAGCEDNPSEPIPAPESEFHIAIAGDNSLQFYDPEDNTWREPVGIGLGANQILAKPFGGPELYVLNSVSHTLQRIVYENGNWSSGPTVDLGLERNTSPFDAAALTYPHIAVTNLLANSVSIVDVNQMDITAEYPVGRAPAGVIGTWNASDTLYVVNSGYDFSDFSFHTGSLYQMDNSTGEILDSLALGTNPQFLTWVRSDELHVVCTGNYQDIEGEVWVVNINPLSVKQVIEVGHSPGRLTIDYDQNTVCLAAGGWSNEGDEEGLILRYNRTSYETLEPLSASLGVVDVVFSHFDQRIYAVCRDAMKLDAFENSNRVLSIDLDDPPNVLTEIP